MKAAGRLPVHVSLSTSMIEKRPDVKSKSLYSGHLMYSRRGPTVFMIICKRIFNNFGKS
jgi:hypothetical protein